MNYRTHYEIGLLESIKDVKGLNKEQIDILEKVIKDNNDTVYIASYDKDDVVNEVFEYFENGKGLEIKDPSEAEKKVLNDKTFFSRVKEDLTDWDGYPDWDNFQDTVDNLAEKHFEVVDGKLFVKGLADN